MTDDFPLANTAAARMLSEGLNRAKEEQGLSIRQIGKLMGYKTAVVLSHMALGRVPIPIDRAEEIADIINLDKKTFLQAVVQQRHPDVAWHLLFSGGQPGATDTLAQELEAVLGARLKDLSREQRAIMREIVASKSPRRRWLSVHELHAVEVLREAFPGIQDDGLDQKNLDGIRSAARRR